MNINSSGTQQTDMHTSDFIPLSVVLSAHGRERKLRVQAHHGGDGGVWIITDETTTGPLTVCTGEVIEINVFNHVFSLFSVI